jgi:hypothetical protein
VDDQRSPGEDEAPPRPSPPAFPPEPPRAARNFVVYFCAFAGAGWFGFWIYSYRHYWDYGYTWIIGAALVVAAWFAWLAERD